MTQNSRFLLAFVSIIYLIWSSLFIHNSSFIAIDGQRYFSLVDDAMISMRYAWNLSHGYGLVWNPNERVEGYSNLFMALIMSLATRFFDKKMAVLAMQILGVAIVLICAWLTREVAKEIFKNHPKSTLLQFLSFTSVLFYYYLSYWSLMGMETGLLTALLLLSLLFILRWLSSKRDSFLYLSAIASGMAFLTRNDALIFFCALFIYLFWSLWKASSRNKTLFKILLFPSLYSLFVFGLILFRWFYYHELTPNTYTLKVSMTPDLIRVNDGIVYVFAFIRTSIIPLIFALIGVIFWQDRTKWIFLGVFCTSILYQIWIGGDAWSGWRFILPSLPLVFILGIAGMAWFGESLGEKIQIGNRLRSVHVLTIAFSIIFVLSIIFPFWSRISFQQKFIEAEINKHNIDVAIAINELTTPDAKIGVFFAGLIPYYTDRYSIDFLGKSDKYVANLYPHLPKNIAWLRGPITMPGHNKYDLNYSIKKLQPDYIQRFYWGQQNIRGWAIQRYVRLEYQGTDGAVTLIVKKQSPFIHWNKGKVLLWGSKQ